MSLKNYTTEVPASRSIGYIEQLLVDFGSTNIMKEYGPTGRVAALSFIVEMDGMKLPFRLPAKVQECFTWLRKKKRARKGRRGAGVWIVKIMKAEFDYIRMLYRKYTVNRNGTIKSK